MPHNPLPFAAAPHHYKLAVTGKNISYSKSPTIHSAFGKALGIDVDYTIQDVGDETFEAKITELQATGFYGCNITVPYKENAFAIATYRSERAVQAQAANTFVFNDDGTIRADNTDGIGFIRDVTENIGYELAGKRILITGAGGAVSGILGPLVAQNPANITIANRTIAKAEALAKRFATDTVTLHGCGYDTLADSTFDIIIDGSSLKDTMVPIPDSVILAADALVYDLKYSPTKPTEIMTWAHSRSVKKIHDGIGMLVEQAAVAFELWTGKKPITALVLGTLR